MTAPCRATPRRPHNRALSELLERGKADQRLRELVAEAERIRPAQESILRSVRPRSDEGPHMYERLARAKAENARKRLREQCEIPGPGRRPSPRRRYLAGPSPWWLVLCIVAYLVAWGLFS